MAKVYDLGTTWIKRFKDDTCIVVNRKPHDVYVGIVYRTNIYEVAYKLDITNASDCAHTYRAFIDQYKSMKREEAYELVSGNPCTVYMEGDKVNDSLLGICNYINRHITKGELDDDVSDED